MKKRMNGLLLLSTLLSLFAIADNAQAVDLLDANTVLKGDISYQIAVQFAGKKVAFYTIQYPGQGDFTFQGNSHEFVGGVDIGGFTHIGNGVSCAVTAYSANENNYILPTSFEAGTVSVSTDFQINSDNDNVSYLTLNWTISEHAGEIHCRVHGKTEHVWTAANVLKALKGYIRLGKVSS